MGGDVRCVICYCVSNEEKQHVARVEKEEGAPFTFHHSPFTTDLSPLSLPLSLPLSTSLSPLSKRTA